MTKEFTSLHPETRLAHPRRPKVAPGNEPIVSPLYQTAKFVLNPNLPAEKQFLYTRISNPTLQELELSLADIQKREECVVVSSGIAAITSSLLALLKAGDHLIIFRELYRPSRIFVRELLTQYGITYSMLKLGDHEALEKAIIPGKTKLIYFESPSNPNLQLADIPAMTKIAKKHGVLTLLDGTFAGLHQHTTPEIDLVAHSLTKFANGHGDIVAGSVAGPQSLIQEIRKMTSYLGPTLDPHAAFLISRGLKTYFLRYERQTRTAETLANWLLAHPKILRVYYPTLPDHPGRELAKLQMKDMGGIVSFELDPSCGTAREFCSRFDLFKFTASVGSTESLICPTQAFFGGDLTAQDEKEMGLNPHSVRISVGLEHPDDLIAELQAALK